MTQIDVETPFPYIKEVNDSIEAVLDRLSAQDPKIFIYRGIDLKYAIAKSLHFNTQSSASLISFYHGLKPQNESIWEVPTLMDKLLLLQQSKGKLHESQIKISPLRWDQYFSWPYRWPSVLRNLKAKLKAKKSNIEHVDTLFYVIHEKFVRYLKPITNQLSNYAYLGDFNGDVQKYLIATNLPHIDGRSLLSDFFWHRSNRILKDFNYLTSLVDLLYSSLTKIKPKRVVTVEGNSPQDEVMNQVCKALGIPCICVQHGWAPYIHLGFRHLSFEKFLSWGTGFSELLSAENPKCKFVETGSHIIKIRKDPVDLSSRNAIGFYLQSSGEYIGTQGWNLFLQFIQNVAEEHSKLTLLVREHPSDRMTEAERDILRVYPNIQIVDFKSVSLMDMFDQSFLSVSIYSTVILESAAAGIPALIFNMTSLPHISPSLEAEGAGRECKDLQSALAFVRTVVNNRAELDKFQEPLRRFQQRFFSAEAKSDALTSIVSEFNDTKAQVQIV